MKRARSLISSYTARSVCVGTQVLLLMSAVVALKNWTPSRGSILVFGEEEKLRWESRADLARSSKQE